MSIFPNICPSRTIRFYLTILYILISTKPLVQHDAGESVYDEHTTKVILMPIKFQIKKYFDKCAILNCTLEKQNSIDESLESNKRFSFWKVAIFCVTIVTDNASNFVKCFAEFGMQNSNDELANNPDDELDDEIEYDLPYNHKFDSHTHILLMRQQSTFRKVSNDSSIIKMELFLWLWLSERYLKSWFWMFEWTVF